MLCGFDLSELQKAGRSAIAGDRRGQYGVQQYSEFLRRTRYKAGAATIR